ncbi:UvrD-helicase domain-containing protein [Salinimonas marina]|nr:UvrD-helicase domain-containing protein [Salinimonas marina]
MDQQHTVALDVSDQQWLEGTFLQVLRRQIGALRPLEQVLSAGDIFTRFHEQGLLAKALRRLTRALTVVRAQNLDDQTLAARLQHYPPASARVWASALQRLHEAYQQQLHSTDSIDFDAMIVQAGNLIGSQHYQPGYRHILVDEFQDISAPRMQLLQQLLDKGPAPTLTAVGDDWQSIYRFSGSQLALTTRFEAYFGSHCLTLLQQTFRYNSSIAHTAGLFVMQNPEQYRKQVVSAHQSDTPQVFLLDDQIYSQQDPAQRAKQVVMALRKQNPEAKIAIMARYQFWLSQAKEALRPLSQTHLCYWTFHGAKGLEADHCILLGFNQGSRGFPGASQDDALVEALLPSVDAFPYGEERRLCYVALTRARHSCYIIADPRKPSPFAQELRQPEYQVKTLSERFGQSLPEARSQATACPECEQGVLTPVQGHDGLVYQCTTGEPCPAQIRVCPECQAPAIAQKTQSVCVKSDCQFTQPLCPNCARPLALRSGPNGQFYGCTGYGAASEPCRFTTAVR